MMQLLRFILSIVVGVGGLLCYGERVDNDWWLQDMTNINDQMSCVELKPCTITYLRSHEVSWKKFKASTMYQLCLVPPDGTTVLPLEVLYFQTGNKSFIDCQQGRGNTDYSRFRISQNGSNGDLLFECHDGMIDKMLMNVSFIKPPLMFTLLTGPVEEEGFLFKIDFSKDPQCSLPSPVHGGLSSWSTWSNCTHSCGGGTQVRERMCNSPTPEYGGEDCDRDLIDILQCSSQPCNGNESRGNSLNGWMIATIICLIVISVMISGIFIVICTVRYDYKPVKKRVMHLLKIDTSVTKTDPRQSRLPPPGPPPSTGPPGPSPPPGPLVQQGTVHSSPNTAVDGGGRPSENTALTHSNGIMSSPVAAYTGQAPAGQSEVTTANTQLPNAQGDGIVEAANNNIISSASSLDPIETSQLLPNVQNLPSTSVNSEAEESNISSAELTCPIETVTTRLIESRLRIPENAQQ